MMNDAEINVGKNALGMRAIVAIDKQSGLRVVIPLNEAGAKAVAEGLIAGLVMMHKKIGNNGG